MFENRYTRGRRALSTLAAVVGVALAVVAVERGPEAGAGVLLAIAPAAVPSKRLREILGELKKLQDDHKGKAMPEDVAAKFEDLATEAKSLQDEADRAARLADFEAKGGIVDDPALPAERKAGGVATGAEVLGYIPLGALYVQSKAYADFVAAGLPKIPEGGRFDIKADTSTLFVPVTRDMIEAKAIADASGLIPRDRLNRIVEPNRPARLFLRDMVEVLATSSNAIDYTTMSYTEAAAIVAASGVKPESGIVTGNATTTVRDIAVTMPIREQTLQDAPQLAGIVSGRMTRDLRKTEEREMLWGDGTGLLGIFQTPGVGEMVRVRAGATMLDRVRMCVTDIQLADMEPNAVAMHPLDVEDVQLLKGTDSRYVWIVVTDPATGQLRIWGLSIVPTTAVVRPGFTERRALVGAFSEAAILWDRSQVSVAMGWVNDQFRRNERTLRVEERVAFAAHTPFGFRYLVTANAGA
jgi:HK97 family phage major capsid protein